jgi:large subunit ribosomal protein L22
MTPGKGAATAIEIRSVVAARRDSCGSRFHFGPKLRADDALAVEPRRSSRKRVAMISRASGNFQRIAIRKARMVVNLVRGRDAQEALQLLDFTPKAGAPFVKKVIASAIANAKQKRPDVDVDELYISKATADKGPDQHMRRWRPRAMGRATRISKGLSHIDIELDVR